MAVLGYYLLKQPQEVPLSVIESEKLTIIIQTQFAMQLSFIIATFAAIISLKDVFITYF